MIDSLAKDVSWVTFRRVMWPSRRKKMWSRICIKRYMVHGRVLQLQGSNWVGVGTLLSYWVWTTSTGMASGLAFCLHSILTLLDRKSSQNGSASSNDSGMFLTLMRRANKSRLAPLFIQWRESGGYFMILLAHQGWAEVIHNGRFESFIMKRSSRVMYNPDRYDPCAW